MRSSLDDKSASSSEPRPRAPSRTDATPQPRSTNVSRAGHASLSRAGNASRTGGDRGGNPSRAGRTVTPAPPSIPSGKPGAEALAILTQSLGSAITGRPKTSIESDSGVSVKLRLDSLFLGELCAEQVVVDARLTNIEQFRVRVRVNRPLLTPDHLRRLNPMQITIDHAGCLPPTPVPFADLQKTCRPVNVRYSFFDQPAQVCIRESFALVPFETPCLLLLRSYFPANVLCGVCVSMSVCEYTILIGGFSRLPPHDLSSRLTINPCCMVAC